MWFVVSVICLVFVVSCMCEVGMVECDCFSLFCVFSLIVMWFDISFLVVLWMFSVCFSMFCLV